METKTLSTSERKHVDLLVSHFWRLGYFTISRRFGTYLPEPARVGKFRIDILGRQKNKYAIGLSLTKDDLYNRELIDKLSFLSSRKTKFANTSVLLIVGVPLDLTKRFKLIVNRLKEEERKNIKVVQITENPSNSSTSARKKRDVLFS